MYRSASLLVFILSSIAAASVLRIPEEYSNIRDGVFAAAVDDTILLAPGVYTDTVTLNRNITIASQFLFSNDTTVIPQTIWSAVYPRALMTPDCTSINLVGIRFESNAAGQSGRGVVNGFLRSLSLQFCQFSGTFDPTASLGNATLRVRTTTAFRTAFLASDCRIDAPATAISPWFTAMHGGTVRIERCLATGRGTNSYLFIDLSTDSVIIKNSEFRISGAGIRAFGIHGSVIDSCRFSQFTKDVLVTGASAGGTTITNTLFEQCSDQSYDLTEIIDCGLNNNNIVLIRNVTIKQIVQVNQMGNFAILRSASTNTRIIDSEFSENSLLPGRVLFRLSNTASIDSCKFYRNECTGGFAEFSLNSTSMMITASDFDSNSFGPFATQLDSLIAPNCWWGDASGPNYPGNPNGQGQWLPQFANPVPWRTSPVFPVNAIGDREQSNSIHEYAILRTYPNPANSSVTITYSLPQSEKNTRIELFDPLGRRVSILYDGYLAAGEHRFQWQPEKTSSGTYFVRATNEFSTPANVMAIQFVK